MKTTRLSKAPLRLPTGWLPILHLLLLAVLLPARADDPTVNPTLPKDASVSLGALVTFQVSATTTNPPLTFQWQHEGTNLDGATLITLRLTNVTELDAGAYQAIVWNAGGDSATSRVATLTVDSTFTKITSGPPATDAEGSTTATWIDYDLDGDVDLFVGNGVAVSNSLYQNNGDGTFSKVTNALTTILGNSWGVAWGDYDNDGKPDLFVAHPRNVRDDLFHNEGGGQFTRVTHGQIVTDPLDSVMPLWGDYDGDGFIDLFLPTGYWSGAQYDRLYHNERDGSFRITTTNEVGDLVANRTLCTGYGWNDYDNDGDLDLFVETSSSTSARWTNFVFRNSPNAPFERLALPAFDEAGYCQGGAWGDYDNDGYLDLFMPSWTGTNALMKNLQGAGFANVAEAAGLQLQMASSAFAWADYDNDGWLDLFVGNFQGQPGYPGGNAVFHNNRDGTFTRITSGSFGNEGGYVDAVACGDYDNDGFVDIYFACGDGTPQRNLFYRNNGNTNHWLKVRLNSLVSNRLGIGAKVRVLAQIGGQPVWQTRAITAQHSWVGDNGLIAHFGLGDATNVDLIRVEWPSGNVQELANQGLDQPLTISELSFVTPRQPSASLNGSVTLTRTAVSGATYQWRFDGVDLPGQTNRSLTLTGITADMAGRYSVVVTSDSTPVTNHVYLVVDTQFERVTTGPHVTDIGCMYNSSWGDYDNDGDPDLLSPRYSPAETSRIYMNTGDGTFITATNPFPSLAGGSYGIMADFDNSGWLDLFAVHQRPPSSFYYSEAGQSLSPVALPITVSQFWNVSAADFDRDGWLDLFFTWPNRLLRNQGGRVFEPTTVAQVGDLLRFSTFGGACWGDYDDDGWVDVFAPQHQGSHSYMFHNEAGRFSQADNAVTQASATALAGAWGDYDNDGRLDLAVARSGGTSTIYRNLGNGQFEAATTGVTISGSYNSASWADYDNDGYLDLFMTWGNSQKNSLFRNNGNGTFSRITTGSLVTDAPIGGAGSYNGLWFDANNDGFLDLYVSNGDDAGTARTANFFYLNHTNSNHWLQVRLLGTTSNPQGIGAKVRARARLDGRLQWQRRDITAGDAFNGNQLYAHFGLGDATNITTLRIEWPSGTVQELTNIASDHILEIIEPRRPVLALLDLSPSKVDGSLRADPATDYVIEASDDLASWTELATVTTDASGIATWSDTSSPPAAHRYYKASRSAP
jgi:hypothetical protein